MTVFGTWKWPTKFDTRLNLKKILLLTQTTSPSYPNQTQLLPFLSGYLVVPGAGIDDDEEDREVEAAGAAGCIEQVCAAGDV